MTAHSETRILPYTPAQMYALVAAVEDYPRFLPWCTGVRVYERSAKGFLADLSVGFKGLSYTYTSRVSLTPDTKVQAAYVRGPFKHLTNNWHFKPHPSGCALEFDVAFEFNSRLLQTLAGAFFHEAFRHMVSAFEKRAQALYGVSESH